MGRFEVYFNPTHPDPITPGRRDRASYCQTLSGFFGLFMMLGCKTSVVLVFASTLCIPEITLYMVNKYVTDFRPLFRSKSNELFSMQCKFRLSQFKSLMTFFRDCVCVCVCVCVKVSPRTVASVKKIAVRYLCI